LDALNAGASTLNHFFQPCRQAWIMLECGVKYQRFSGPASDKTKEPALLKSSWMAKEYAKVSGGFAFPDEILSV
jgi:hypothetical protein